MLRRCQMAQVELKERGQFAKFHLFTSQWPFSSETNAQRLSEEIERLTNNDNKYNLALKSMTTEEQWRTCLKDAYDLIFKIAAPPAGADADFVPTPILGLFAIRQLLLDGRLLDLPRHEYLEELKNLDQKCLGVIPFEELFHWFCRIAYTYDNQGDNYYDAEEDLDKQTDGWLSASLSNMFSSTGGSVTAPSRPGTGARAGTPSSGVAAAAGSSSRFLSLRPSSRQEKERRALASRKIMKFNLSTLVSVRIRALISLHKRFGSEEGAKEEFDMAAFKDAYAKMKKKKAAESDVDIDLRLYDYDF